MTITDPSTPISTCAACGRTGSGEDWTDQCAECRRRLCKGCMKQGCCGRVPARSVRTLRFCVVCGLPCISMCGCGRYVHQHFGQNNRDCGGAHEARCGIARESRSLERPKLPPHVPVAGAPPATLRSRDRRVALSVRRKRRKRRSRR